MAYELNVGFTGTQRGMSEEQQGHVKDILLVKRLDAIARHRNTDCYFHHGGCIGADEQAAIVAGNLGYFLRLYPSNIPSKQLEFVSHPTLTHDPKPPLKRNHDIVNICDILIATPHEYHEILRSGTWATVRYARKKNKLIYLIWPTGGYRIEGMRVNGMATR